jgi:hypothetical protein
MTTLTTKDVDFEIFCEPEEMQIRGNCMASGDDAEDEDCALWIENELAGGNEWAWCSVRVTASWNGLEAHDYLGGCSYACKKDFTAEGGYFDDMKAQAFALLQEQIPRPGEEVIVREEVNHTVKSVDMEAKTATLEDGRTVPFSDTEPYKSL